MKNIKQGDIFFTDLTSNIGSEQKSLHPVMVVSNNVFNKNHDFVIVVTITSAIKTQIPTHTILDKENTNLSLKSWALCEQIHIVNKNNIHHIKGRVNFQTRQQVLYRLKISLGMIQAKKPADCDIQRGEIYNTNTGLMLIIQNDIGNKYSPTTIGISVTFKGSLDVDFVTLEKRVQTIDKQRLYNKIGKVSDKKMESVNKIFYKIF